MISRMDKTSFDGESQSCRKTIDYPAVQSQVQASSSNATSQVNVKLTDLEQRIKHKLGNIKQLESLLDSILGKQRDQAGVLPQLASDINSL